MSDFNVNSLRLGSRIVFLDENKKEQLGYVKHISKSLNESCGFIPEEIKVLDSNNNEINVEPINVVKEIDLDKVYNSEQYKTLMNFREILSLARGYIGALENQIDNCQNELCISGKCNVSFDDNLDKLLNAVVGANKIFDKEPESKAVPAETTPVAEVPEVQAVKPL